MAMQVGKKKGKKVEYKGPASMGAGPGIFRKRE